MEYVENASKIAGLILAIAAVIALGAKVVLLPWLKSNLVEPVQEVNKQLTVNNNVSDPATALDTIHSIELKIDSIEETMHKMALDAVQVGAATGVIQRMWDHHLDWSEQEVKRLWRAIEHLSDKDEKHE